MKHEKISIKWKVFIYMLSFCAILLCLLWFFQTVYLDKFYKNIKKKEIDNAMENVLEVINNTDAQEAINMIAERYDICILVTDEEGKKVYSAGNANNCSIHKYSTQHLLEIYEKTEDRGGEMEISNHRGKPSESSGQSSESSGQPSQPEAGNQNEEPPSKKSEKPGGEPPTKKTDNTDAASSSGSMENPGSAGTKKEPEKVKESEKYEKLPNMPNNVESIIKIKMVPVSAGETYAVMIDSVITPIDATVHTLRIQLVYISIIMVVLSLMIAFIISKRVSKSIIKINTTAKEFGKGNFEVEFDGKDYKEIAELSETLNYAAKELSKTDLLQKELLANVSHDLRTPLTMITAYSEVMRDLPGENTPENVQVIIDEANRLTNLVNDLLDISKIQAGVARLETKEYDITESIKAIIERHSKLLEPYGYTIDFEYHENIIVEADEFKIYQVIYNLIANAVNYAGEDKYIKVTQLNQNDSVRIEVKDNGQGIEKEKLDSVWERYYKIDKNHKRAIVGTGLGLSIVKNILVMHNAKYGVISEVGKGSTFWFELKKENEVPL